MTYLKELHRHFSIRLDKWPARVLIYGCWCRVCGKYYIGHTRQLTISRRHKKHRSNYKSKSKRSYQLYEHMRLHGIDQFEIQELDRMFCYGIDEAKRLEQVVIDKYGGVGAPKCLNQVNPCP